MKLLLFIIMQAATSVTGMGLLTIALHGRPFTAGNALQAATGWHGLLGIAFLFVSFILLGAIVSLAKLSTYIPISTAISFAFTVLWTVVVDRESVSVSTIIGMALILAGISAIAMGR
ncbi:MAG: hypothetical protein FGM24_11070 [Candidatus Kapabacteria bacterium]|nr:hypothetical protein [Candidatus Kapabacteria bacterium]